MSPKPEPTQTLSCSCGNLAMTAHGAPLMTVSCYCQSCQTAARRLAPPDGAGVKDTDGGTRFVMYRKDRVDCSHVSHSLREHRLAPDRTTRRVVAACCGAPLFLEFEKGHWLSFYAARLPEAQCPPVEIRTMVGDAPAGTQFADGIPSYRTHSLSFMGRLFWAWARMGFRSREIEVLGEPLTEKASQTSTVS